MTDDFELTSQEAADLIRCTVGRVQQLCKEYAKTGEGLVNKKRGRDWWVSRKSAEQYRDREQGRGQPRSGG